MAQRRHWIANRLLDLGKKFSTFASESGVNESTAARWLSGESVPAPRNRRKMAHALQMSIGELNAKLAGEHDVLAYNAEFEDVDRREIIKSTMLAAISGSLSMPFGFSKAVGILDLPDNDIVNALALEVQSANQHYQAAQYSSVEKFLPWLLSTTEQAYDQVQQEVAERLRSVECQAHLLAAKLENKLGNDPAVRLHANLARGIAIDIGNPFSVAASTYQLACADLHEGLALEAEDKALEGAMALRGDDCPTGVTWAGALTLLSAMAAASRKDSRSAELRLDTAEALAKKLGYDGNIGWTAFGPSNVNIHRISAAARMEDAAQTIDLYRDLKDATRLKLRGRRSQVHVDSAWAFAKNGDDASATLHLLEAERLSAESLTRSRSGRGTLQILMARESHSGTPGLRELATRLGVAS